MQKFTIKSILLILLAGTFFACQKRDIIKAPGAAFDLDVFEQNIKNFLADSTIGYSYSISVGGVQQKKGAGGDAVASWDTRTGKGIPHAPDKRQDLASCSKTYTALTLMRLLQDQNKSEKALLVDYLPSFWKKPAWSFNEINFEMLMRHESGLLPNGIGYGSLKALVEGGGIFLHDQYNYQNVNYAFLRIAIAYLSHEMDLKALETKYTNNPSEANEKALETAISTYYIEQVNEKVFAKCGIPYTYPKPDGEINPTMNYNFRTQDRGWNKGDMTLFAGSAGWRLSAQEQNKILAYLKYTEKVLNNTWKSKMNDRRFGWSGIKALKGGTAYYHGGYFEDKYSPNNAADPKGRGCYTVHVIFGNNVEAAVQVNSLGATPNMESVVLASYNNAWVD